jgi:hypothetical protein
MRTGSAVLVCVVILGGCSFSEEIPADRHPPALSWGLGEGEAPVEGLIGHAPRVRGDATAQFVFYVRADDRGGLRHLSLSGIGTLRCATRDGSWVAPYDFIVPVADADVSRPLARATGARAETYAHLSVPLQLASVSCGRHPVPGYAEDQELVPQRGTVLLRAYAVDAAGKSAESVLTLVLRPSARDRQVAALASGV